MLDQIYKHTQAVQSLELEGETLITQVDSDQFFGLDDVSSKVWQALDGQKTVGTICQELFQQFEVSPDQCQADVVEFVQSLLDGKLIEPV